MTDTDLMAWREQRNKVLRSMDVDAARKMMPTASASLSDDTILMSLHKARAECIDLDSSDRLASIEWLRERHLGLMSGPLPPPGVLPA